MSINLARGITVGAGVIGGVGLLGFLSGCSNPYTPAGQEGYVYEKPRWFGKGGYKGTIKGPGNFGNSLLKLEVINIELRPTTYATEVMVRTLDKVLVPLPVQVKISVKPGTSREVIEGIGDNWYESYVKPSLASTIRDVAMDIPTLSLKDQSGEIASRIATKMNAFLKEKPFVLHEVMVGDIYFPKEVQENIDRQLALKQEVEKRFLEIALEKDVKARERGLKELEAGIAASLRAINASAEANAEIILGSARATVAKRLAGAITPGYIALEAVQAQKLLAANPGLKMVYIPLGPDGSIPMLHLNVDQNVTQGGGK